MSPINARLRLARGRLKRLAQQRAQAAERRVQLAKLLRLGFKRMECIRRLGISETCYYRDLRALQAAAQATHQCPICGNELPTQRWLADETPPPE